jgi:hypothetical protein
LYITDYFRKIDQVILNCPAIISKEILFDQRTKYIGFVRGTLVFRDGSELYFKEFIDSEFGIVKYKYGYHYQNEENIIPASIPDLEDVLKEVIMHLP